METAMNGGSYVFNTPTPVHHGVETEIKHVHYLHLPI